MTGKVSRPSPNASLSVSALLARLVEKPDVLLRDAFLLGPCRCGSKDIVFVQVQVLKRDIIEVDLHIDFLCRSCYELNVSRRGH